MTPEPREVPGERVILTDCHAHVFWKTYDEDRAEGVLQGCQQDGEG